MHAEGTEGVMAQASVCRLKTMAASHARITCVLRFKTALMCPVTMVRVSELSLQELN